MKFSWQEVSIPQGHIVEVIDAHHMLREGLAAHLL
jgi:hypothetical protein